MIHVSSYIKKNNKFQELSSPYLDCKLNTKDESFNSKFKKFVALLAREDASYNDNSLVIINKKIDDVIKSIKDETIFIEFKNTMKKISNIGDLGKLVYDNYKIENMAISTQNEIFIVNNDKFYDLENRVNYLINKSISILNIESFNDYDFILNDLSNIKIELLEYNDVDNVDYIKISRLKESIDKCINDLKQKAEERDNIVEYNNILLKLLEEL